MESLDALAADPSSIERFSVLVDAAPLIVQAAPGPVDLELVARFLRSVPTVTVLCGVDTDADVGLARAFDVCVPTEAEAGRIASTVAAQPLAALALVAQLRMVAQLDTWAGLAAESAAYGMLLGGAAFRAWRSSHPARTRDDDDGPRVVVTRVDDRLSIVLNRPGVHNAIDTAMRDALVEALQLAAGDSSVARIELRGEGPSFSSGGDLDEFGSVGDGSVAHAVRLTRHPGWWIDVCSTRLAVRLHGACVGAGVELPAFAAEVEADPATVFSLPEVSMGLIPGAGGTVSVTRRIGRQRCAWLALTGEAIDAPTALDWGLIDRIR